jgi:pimeloyl-ACP methyl ester carboxylesterase
VRRAAFGLLALFPAVFAACTTVPARDHSPAVEVRLPAGALWSAIVPPNWNGTLLLHSRGYAGQAGSPDPAPAPYRDRLLAEGYALAASNYGSGGWALAEAVPAQEQTVAAFARRYGKPRRVLGYGFSMGGLVTTALAERANPAIDGGVSLCSSMGGTLAMMNMGLDGAFVFRTLVAPDAGIALVGIADDRANAGKAATAAQSALATPAGRARIALAAVLAGIPAWRPPGGMGDADEQKVEALARALPAGVFLPRAEQEQRAGGIYSWNTGVDYAALLDRSGQEPLIRRLYAKAGLDFAADLALLAHAPRISAQPGAVAYMAANYSPTGRPTVPLLAVQALNDPITSPSLQEGYAAAASPRMVQSLYLPLVGHCNFTPEQIVEAIHRLELRLERNVWPPPAPMHADERPSPLLRPCFRKARMAASGPQSQMTDTCSLLP